MTGIILAAGDGVRFNNSTGYECCKALNKINNMHLIEFALDNLVNLNISDCIVVVGAFAKEIKTALKENYKGIKLTYVEQPSRKGVINALMMALSVIDPDKKIVLQLADEVFSGFNIEEIKNNVEKAEYDFYCGITYEENVERVKNNYSVDADADMNLKKCTEKPETVVNNIKGTGFCIFNVSSLDYLKDIYDENKNTPYDLCDYLNLLVQAEKKGLCLCVAEREFNINTYSELVEARKHFSCFRG